MYVIELSFHPDQRRFAARPAHRELLNRHHADGRLVLAGPWHDDSGALLVFDTDETGIEEVMDADPYYRTPGVTVVSVRRWEPIVGGPRK
jgi:hypothetical protein